MLQFNKLLVFLLVFISCDTGKLEVITDLPGSLKEASAIEKVAGSDLLWTIEDSGNKNNIYGLNTKGKIIKDIDISNASNIDWEDLTSDDEGNLYIGDIGNNSKNRDDFTIYKVSDLNSKKTKASKISFKLPKQLKPKDFEGFFLWNGFFYLFSKDNKSTTVIRVPNEIGMHTAEYLTKYKMKGNHTKITSADISNDGNTIILLNHDKLWKITGFTADDFFNGHVEILTFDHNTQKEGICFKDGHSVYITDEKTKDGGGNLYAFKLH